jgi:hypothetical protein
MDGVLICFVVVYEPLDLGPVGDEETRIFFLVEIK